MSEPFYCSNCMRDRDLDEHLRCSVCGSDQVSDRGVLPEMPEYQPLHPEEIAEIEDALGRRITDEEALKFIRAGRVMAAFEDWLAVKTK